MKYDEIKIILIRIVYIAGFLVSSFVLLLLWGLITAVTMPGVTPSPPPDMPQSNRTVFFSNSTVESDIVSGFF